MAESAVVVLPDPSTPPGWAAAVDARPVPPPDPAATDGELQRAGCALLDGTAVDPVGLARRVHRVDPSLQMVIVIPAEHRARLDRALLFAPGIGEVWVAPPEEVGAGLVQRAAAVTRQRRAYRASHARLEHDLAAIEPHAARRAFVSDAYLAALLAALPDPVLSVDEADRVLSWNPAAEQLFGRSRGETLGRPLAEVLRPQEPETLARLAAATGQPARGQIGFLRADGEAGTAEIIVVPVEAAGRRVRAVCIRDVTEERRLQAEREAQAAELEMQTEELQSQATQLEEAQVELEMVNTELVGRTAEAESARAQLEAVLRQMPSGVVIAEAPSGRLLFGNAQVDVIWRRPFVAAEAVGEYGAYVGYHPDGRPYRPEEWPLARSATRGEVVLDEEIEILRGDGSRGTISVNSTPVADRSGTIVAAVAIFDDITQHRAREQRDSFLVEAAHALSFSLDYQETLAGLARLAVPRIADWCAVDMLEEGRIRRLAVVHSDPAKERLALEVAERWPPDPEAPVGMPQVLRTGEPALFPEVDAELLRRVAHDEEHFAILTELGLRSGMVVPLIARGRTLGAITLVAAESGRLYGADDLAFASQLASHAAIAVDNARLLREAQRAQRRAEDARSEAEAANRAKSEFLANMSHEIRTPINAVMGYTDLMRMGIGGDPSDTQRGYLDRIRSSNQHLLGLINEILDLAKVEAGRMEVRQERAAAADVIGEAVALVGPQAESREIEVRAPCAADRVTHYVGDPDRVRQILVNLLSNAVKFTQPGGTVTVTCGYSGAGGPNGQEDEPGRWALLRVADTGIGIEPDQLERVFRPFVQAEGGYTREVGGTGLGLAISRQLAILMGGDLTAVSEPGRGSVFTLWLPRELPLEAAALHEAEAGSAPRGVAQVGAALLSEVTAVVAAFRERLRDDPAVPMAASAGDADLADHLPSFLSDLAVALMAIEESQRMPLLLLQDSGEIQRLVASLHGRQRAQLGWTEEALRRESDILREELERVLQRMAPHLDADIPGALAWLDRYIDRATEISLRGFRIVENSAMHPMRGHHDAADAD